MGMTFNQLALVRAVSENNLSKAKAAALACCAEDTTQKNKEMVSRLALIKLLMLASSSTIRILYLLLPIVLTPSFQSKAEYRAAALPIFRSNLAAVRLDDGGARG